MEIKSYSVISRLARRHLSFTPAINAVCWDVSIVYGLIVFMTNASTHSAYLR